ncbi:MAG: translocase [Epsilonproteobacteria bacterium]|nr:MAG: translocase [Campylobacterota bacterium]
MFSKLKPKSEFSKNVLTLMTGTTIAQAVPIAISPILTRIYTPEDFGIFALFIAIVGFFSVIASARYEQAILIPIQDKDAINIFALGFIIIFMISILLIFIVVMFNDTFTMLLNNEAISVWLYFIPVTVLFVGVFNLLIFLNNRKKEYKDIAKATMLKSIVLVVVQLSVGFFKSGADGLISGQIISQIFANIKLMKNIFNNKLLLSNINKIKILVLAKKYKNFPKFQAPHAMLNALSSNLPIYFFTPFFGLAVVGLYSLSTRIVFTPLMILSGASAKVYNQQLTLFHNQKKDTYTFTINLLKTLFKKIFIPFILFIYFAPTIFGTVFGEDWREAGVYTQILSPWLFMVFFVSLISFIPNILNLQKKALIIEIIYTISRLIALMIGIYFKSIYIAISLFSIVGFLALSYNISWMLNSLKRYN